MSKLIGFALAAFAWGANAAGYVDGTPVYSNVYGWACDSGSPNVQVPVDAWRDNNLYIGGTYANLPRESAVAAACNSNTGNHGFQFALSSPPGTNDNNWHNVHFYSVGPNVQELQNSPIPIFFAILPPNNFYNTYPNQSSFGYFGNQLNSGSLSTCPGTGQPGTSGCRTSQLALFTGVGFGIDSSIGSDSNSGSIVRGVASNEVNPQVQYMQFNINTGDFFSKNPDAHISIGVRAFMPPEGHSNYAFTEYNRFFDVKTPHAYGNGIILGAYNGDSCKFARGLAVEHYYAPWGTNIPTNVIGNCRNNIFNDNTNYQIRTSVENSTFNGLPTRIVKYKISVQTSSGYSLVAQDIVGTSFPDQISSTYPSWGFTFWDYANRNVWNHREKNSWFLLNIFTQASNAWTYRISNFGVGTGTALPAAFY